MAPHQQINYLAPAFIWSGVLHLVVLLGVLVGLPSAWEKHREALPTAMSVEVVNISDITNIKKKDAQKKETKKKPKKATSKKAVSASSSNQKTEKPKKKLVAPPKKKDKPKPKKKDKPKEKPKPKPKKKEEPKKKADLSSILKSVADAAKKEQGEVTSKSDKEVKKAVSDNYNPSLPMSMTEIDAIRSQFVKCWNIPAGARNAHELRIVLDVRLRSNGSVINVELAKEEGRYYRDGFFRAAVDSAMRAVHRCSPIKNLPPKKYETWKYLQFTFDPRDMLY